MTTGPASRTRPSPPAVRLSEWAYRGRVPHSRTAGRVAFRPPRIRAVAEPFDGPANDQ